MPSSSYFSFFLLPSFVLTQRQLLTVSAITVDSVTVFSFAHSTLPLSAVQLLYGNHCFVGVT